eukprot:338071-Prymnesium_polylepis.1
MNSPIRPTDLPASLPTCKLETGVRTDQAPPRAHSKIENEIRGGRVAVSSAAPAAAETAWIG